MRIKAILFCIEPMQRYPHAGMTFAGVLDRFTIPAEKLPFTVTLHAVIILEDPTGLEWLKVRLLVPGSDEIWLREVPISRGELGPWIHYLPVGILAELRCAGDLRLQVLQDDQVIFEERLPVVVTEV